MSAGIDEKVETAEPSLGTEKEHAYCDVCYPWNAEEWPAMVNAVCGAVVLTATIPTTTSKVEAYILPPGVCSECVALVACPVCGTPA
jgi:hypothetical protein